MLILTSYYAIFHVFSWRILSSWLVYHAPGPYSPRWMILSEKMLDSNNCGLFWLVNFKKTYGSSYHESIHGINQHKPTHITERGPKRSRSTVDGCKILHQLVDGLSHSNPMFFQCFIVSNRYQLVQDFFGPRQPCPSTAGNSTEDGVRCNVTLTLPELGESGGGVSWICERTCAWLSRCHER